MLVMKKNEYDLICKHVRESYPHECCGMFLGILKDTECREVSAIFEAENLNKEQANDRYELNPKDFLRADRYSEKNNLRILGFYHSHPDHPSRPSVFDSERAWETYSYVIVAVKGGKECEANSFVLNSETRQFEQEELQII